jgi:cysteine-rich repeat protein
MFARRVRESVFGAALIAFAAVPASALTGDCNGTGEVEIADLVTAINVALGETPLETCRAGDADADGIISVDELLTAVLRALDGPPLPAERCGNNIVNTDEQCDDGNQDTGDGCDGECRFEGIGVLDQYWSGYRPGTCGGTVGGGNVGLLGPFAQEFVPQLRAVTTLLIDAVTAGGSAASALRLNIRHGTFDGPLLGWTSTVVPNPPNSSRQNWIRFDLPAPVAVTPGEVYVYELVGYDSGLSVQSSGGEAGCTQREYAPGDPVSHGERIENSDFRFGVFGTNAPGVGAIDQAWLGPQGICGFGFQDAGFAGHALAQTFSPATSALGAVAVPLISIGREPTPAGTLTLKVREGGPSGAVLATVERILTAPADGEAWYVFALDPPLPVTPGATYAIELADAADRFRWSTIAADGPGCTVNEFAGGQAFADGVAIPADFRFATYAP